MQPHAFCQWSRSDLRSHLQKDRQVKLGRSKERQTVSVSWWFLNSFEENICKHFVCSNQENSFFAHKKGCFTQPKRKRPKKTPYQATTWQGVKSHLVMAIIVNFRLFLPLYRTSCVACVLDLCNSVATYLKNRLNSF